MFLQVTEAARVQEWEAQVDDCPVGRLSPFLLWMRARLTKHRKGERGLMLSYAGTGNSHINLFLTSGLALFRRWEKEVRSLLDEIVLLTSATQYAQVRVLIIIGVTIKLRPCGSIHLFRCLYVVHILRASRISVFLSGECGATPLTELKTSRCFTSG